LFDLGVLGLFVVVMDYPLLRMADGLGVQYRHHLNMLRRELTTRKMLQIGR
jgi:hypothetical protein